MLDSKGKSRNGKKSSEKKANFRILVKCKSHINRKVVSLEVVTMHCNALVSFPFLFLWVFGWLQFSMFYIATKCKRNSSQCHEVCMRFVVVFLFAFFRPKLCIYNCVLEFLLYRWKFLAILQHFIPIYINKVQVQFSSWRNMKTNEKNAKNVIFLKK